MRREIRRHDLGRGIRQNSGCDRDFPKARRPPATAYGTPFAPAARVSLFLQRRPTMRTQFHLDGMHSDKCATSIKQSLMSTAGVRNADVTFHGKTVTLEFDEQTVQEKTLVKKVQDLGYGVTVEGQPVSGHA
jgi:copper chaperone CopZ